MNKNNIDKWSIFHALGTALLAYVFYEIIGNYTDAIVATIFSMTLWELMDEITHITPNCKLLMIFDVRGASILDYTIGYVGIGIYLHYMRDSIVISHFDWDYVIIISIICTIVMVALNSISYYMVLESKEKNHE